MIAELLLSAAVCLLGVRRFLAELRLRELGDVELQERRLRLEVKADRLRRDGAELVLEVTEPEPGVLCITTRPRPLQPNIMAIIDPPSGSAGPPKGEAPRWPPVSVRISGPVLHKVSPRFEGSERA